GGRRRDESSLWSVRRHFNKGQSSRGGTGSRKTGGGNSASAGTKPRYEDRSGSRQSRTSPRAGADGRRPRHPARQHGDGGNAGGDRARSQTGREIRGQP